MAASHPFHEMSKLWADQGRAGIASVHVQPGTLYQGDRGGVGDDVHVLGDGDYNDDGGDINVGILVLHR